MRKAPTFLLSFALLLLLLSVGATHPISFLANPAAAPERGTPKLRVLFVGNSYTYFNNLPELLSKLAESAQPSRQLETAMVVRGGATLRMLWEDGAAVKAIKQSHWDYVVLQEQSLLPISDSATMHKYVRLFDSEIKRAGAKTILYMTWARQNRPETQAALTDAYSGITKELHAMLAPVGTAWQMAFKQKSGLTLHLSDQSHPNPTGSYLAACVFYSVIFEKSPDNLTGVIRGHPVNLAGAVGDNIVEVVNIPAADALFLQRVAWQTVKNGSSH